MGMVGGRAWCFALALMVGGPPALASPDASLAPDPVCTVGKVSVEAEGPEGAHAFWAEAPPGDTPAARVTITRTHASGDLFPLGDTLVRLTSTNAAGNSTACELQVEVRDSRPPVLTCPEAYWVSTPVLGGSRAEYPAATAHDAVSDVALTYSPEPGEPLAPGKHQVQVTATDAAGNTSLCTFQVTVEYDPTSDMRKGDMGCATGGAAGVAGPGVLLALLAWRLTGRRKARAPRA
jgi:hypothetical protein